MDKKKFEKYKKVLLLLIAAIFVIQKTSVYMKEKDEVNEIIFYTLPAQNEYETRQLSVDEENNIDTDDEEQVAEPVNGKININTANAEELQKLYRIGPALSSRIIEYREKYGNFDTIEEIMEVKGIGEKTFEKIKDEICVK